MHACSVKLSSSLSLMHMPIYVVYTALLPSLLCLMAMSALSCRCSYIPIGHITGLACLSVINLLPSLLCLPSLL